MAGRRTAAWLTDGHGLTGADGGFFTSVAIFCFRRVELELAVEGTLAAGDGG